ncbi:hypothetical protein HELRODRAFT_191686 [Helobdella robusta]|uniref:Uncharacterized protein n=1 Tax=Helobdella robusta TaxID=6412 RepID=T1FT74_HELRO|nr:hypothetical protein HELRODRAFT_191686 [Helobdella robusta]ESO04678.1 hypothetical protein HELRODRAFT_191686 [Helobdella robusta]
MWSLEEDVLKKRNELNKQQHVQMFEVLRKQAQARHAQEVDEVLKRQEMMKMKMKRDGEEREREFLKDLKVEKRRRMLEFQENLKLKNTQDVKNPSSSPSSSSSETFGGHALSTERESIKKFERMERQDVEKKFQEHREMLMRRKEEFHGRCEDVIQELSANMMEREIRLEEDLNVKLTLEEERSRRERNFWRESVKKREEKLEEEFEKQLNRQHQFYFNVNKNNQDYNQRFFQHLSTDNRNVKSSKYNFYNNVGRLDDDGDIRLELDGRNTRQPQQQQHYFYTHPPQQQQQHHRQQPQPLVELEDFNDTNNLETNYLQQKERHNGSAHLYRSTPDFVTLWLNNDVTEDVNNNNGDDDDDDIGDFNFDEYANECSTVF